jgi:hypothetical protein
MHSRCLAIFPFKLGGEGERIFFHLSLVPNVFPLCSLQVPNGFPSGFQYVHQALNVFLDIFSIAPHFYDLSHML